MLKDAINNLIHLCIYLSSYVPGTGLDAGWDRGSKSDQVPALRGGREEWEELRGKTKHNKMLKSTEWILDRGGPSEGWHLDRDMNKVKELWESLGGSIPHRENGEYWVWSGAMWSEQEWAGWRGQEVMVDSLATL